jgi:LysM repeat protein
MASCTLTGSVPEAPVSQPTPFALPRNVGTCGEVIQAALALEPCQRVNSAICYVFAEYNPDAVNNNLIGSGYIGIPGDVSSVGALAEEAGRRVENATVWRAFVVRTPVDGQTVTLMTSGDTRRSAITPELNTLELETAAEPLCDTAPPPGLLVQSAEGTQASIRVNGANVTVGDTALLTAERNRFIRVDTADGLSVVSSGGVTRVVREGEQLQVPLDGLTVNGEPSPAVPIEDNTLQRAAINSLPNPVTATSRDSSSDQPGQTAPFAGSTDCVPNANWTGEHVVQRGESRARVAPLYDITFQELQAGNCITAPGRLSVGQVLRVPAQGSEAGAPDADQTPTTGPVNIPTTPPDQSPFTADAIEPVAPGTCTYLRWDVADAAQLFLNEQPVSRSGGLEVCPDVTTVYSLRVVYTDGTEETFTQAVLILP